MNARDYLGDDRKYQIFNLTYSNLVSERVPIIKNLLLEHISTKLKTNNQPEKVEEERSTISRWLRRS